MNVVRAEENGIVIFTLDGRVDTEGAVDLDLALQTAVSEGEYRLILDMQEVSYLNSAGLRTLADILQTAQKNGGNLYLAGLNRKILRVLQIIGFDKFFEIFDDVELAARAYFLVPSPNGDGI